MIGPSLMTALYLAGVDAARDMAVWDATHPSVYAASFGAALSVNLLAVAEGVYRFRFNHDANERRRIRMAIYTAAPGVTAYAIKDGLPIVAMLSGVAVPVYPLPVLVLLQALVLLPAFGVSLRGWRLARARPARGAAAQPPVRAGQQNPHRHSGAAGDRTDALPRPGPEPDARRHLHEQRRAVHRC